MRLSAVLLFCAASVALARGSIPVPVRSLVFSTETSVNYVTLTPQKPMNLNAFTLCLRVATQLPQDDRDIILFAYRGQSSDDLNLWRARDGTIGINLSETKNGAYFTVPALGPMQSHVCVTWESSTGATSVFFDGKKSLTKFYRKGHSINDGGQVIIGQDTDSQVGNFDSRQSFVGEISDINLWSRVFPDSFIKEMASSGQTVRNGDVIDWKVANFQINGEVHVIDRYA